MTALATLAKLLGVRQDLAEDALHSERAARAVLTRRSLLAAAGAMASGTVFGFGSPGRWVIYYPIGTEIQHRGPLVFFYAGLGEPFVFEVQP